MVRPVDIPGKLRSSMVRPVPGNMVRPVPGSIVRPVPGSMVRSVPGSVVRPAPGSMVRPVPGSVVRPAPGSMVHPVPGTAPSEGRRPLIKVVVRVRPATDDTCWVRAVDEHSLQMTNHRNTDETLHYKFEQVFGAEADQALIYDSCARPIISSVIDGGNACIFAYGPTGSGKTHTMLGTSDDPGIIPRCVTELFQVIRDTYRLHFSYLEIYNEKVQDLLRPQQPMVDLPIREDHRHNIFVAGLSEECVDTVDQFNELFLPAARNRRTAATSLNKRSSRSHALLMLKVLRVAPSGETAVVGKMNLIDLAGCEDNRRTGNAGIRLKESSAINTSLLALGQVVEALKNGQSCIPYRASKLTRLLQDSLGGTTQTCMIIALSPEECHFQETHSTLGFARQAKKIVTSTKLTDRRHLFAPSHTEREDVPCSMTKAVPFLSPLLREQRKFEGALCMRLERLEQRLMAQMNQTIVNRTVVSNETKVDGDNDVNDRTESGGLDTTFTLNVPDVTDRNATYDHLDLTNDSSDRSDIVITSSSQDLNPRFVCGDWSGKLSQTPPTTDSKTFITDISDAERSLGNGDYSHMPSGSVNFSRGCEDNNELTPFRSGEANYVDPISIVSSVVKLTNIMAEIKSCRKVGDDPSYKLSLTLSAVKVCKGKRKSVFADGSSRLDNFLTVDDILSCSPLFMRPPLVKRRRHAPFVSTAAPRSSVTALTGVQFASPLGPSLENRKNIDAQGEYRPGECSKPRASLAPQHLDAQGEHNDQVLHILNEGGLKQLQSLQTIGAKRAQQIMTWRTLHGQFHEIYDLKKVPGISITKFLSANLIED